MSGDFGFCVIGQRLFQSANLTTTSVCEFGEVGKQLCGVHQASSCWCHSNILSSVPSKEKSMGRRDVASYRQWQYSRSYSMQEMCVILPSRHVMN